MCSCILQACGEGSGPLAAGQGTSSTSAPASGSSAALLEVAMPLLARRSRRLSPSFPAGLLDDDVSRPDMRGGDQ